MKPNSLNFRSTARAWQAIALFGALLGAVAPNALALAHQVTFHPDAVIPDANKSGITDVQTVSAPFTSIQSIRVSVDISDAFNGDLYLYLNLGSTTVALLNRPGRTSHIGLDSFGYADTGIQVTFSDSAINGDIHTYRDAPGYPGPPTLTGEWQPDGRLTDPMNVLDTDLRATALGDFQGLDPNGDWTLFAADLSTGSEAKLNSWSLNIVGVPDPGLPAAFTALLWGTLALIRPRRRTA